MKYSILGFSQEKICALNKIVQLSNGKQKVLKLDITDLLILRDIADFMNRSKVVKFTINDTAYFSITHKTIIEDLPVLDIKKQALKDRIDKMVELGLIKKEVSRNDCGTWVGYRLTDVYEALIYDKNSRGGCSELHGGDVVDYNPNNYTTININYNNNKEKEDKSSIKKGPQNSGSIATLDFPTRKNSDTEKFRHGNLPTLNNIDNIHNIDDKDNIDNEKENSNKKKACDDEDVNEFVEHIYSIYPTRCPKRNTPTGKCSKDKERIKKLLKTYSKEDIEKVVRYEIQEKYGKHYMANFATFLNNFPDPTTIPDVNSNIDMIMSKPKRKVLVINGVEYR